jgi:exodeoxyribonuclease VII small subunit
MASFEERLAALEAVVERLERGELPLDESVRLFEEGMKLSQSCRKELDAAEGRIQVLMEQGRERVPVELSVEEDIEEEKE